MRPDVKRQHGTAHAPSAGSTSPAVAAALDRLLDPIENLRQEGFQSGPVQAIQAEVITGTARLGAPKDPRRRSFHVLALRVRYSNSAPYAQIRTAVFWCFTVIGLLATVWLVIAHASY